MIPESARAEFWPTTSPRRVGLASCARRGAEGRFLCSPSSRFSGRGGGSQGRGGLGSMDSTLALGAFGIARGAGGEAVDVNGNLVEREKGDEFGIETPAS